MTVTLEIFFLLHSVIIYLSNSNNLPATSFQFLSMHGGGGWWITSVAYIRNNILIQISTYTQNHHCIYIIWYMPYKCCMVLSDQISHITIYNSKYMTVDQWFAATNEGYA